MRPHGGGDTHGLASVALPHLFDLANFLADGIGLLLEVVKLVSHAAPLGIELDDLIHHRNVLEPSALGFTYQLRVPALVCMIERDQRSEKRVCNTMCCSHLCERD